MMLKVFSICCAAFWWMNVQAAPETAANTRFQPRPITPRIISVGTGNVMELIRNGKPDFEVVVSPQANATVKFAASELAHFLGEISGTQIKISTQPSGTRPAFLVGDRKTAEKLKLDLKNLDRDGFFIRTDGKNILILGNDDAKGNPAKNSGWFECGTLYGVYDFLERFAGVRFYFPGKIGTVVPRKTEWSLPEISISDRPDNQYRRIYCTGVEGLSGGKLHFPAGMNERDTQRLSELYQRKSTLNLPNCHGLASLGLVQRFAKTHPEYFALKENGKRHDGSFTTRPSDEAGQLCFSAPGLKEEIYQDAAAFLTGKPASSRNVIMPNGKSYWSHSRHSRPFFNIMPNDAMYECKCPACAKDYADGAQAASNHIWRFKTDIANRLKKNGVPGFVTVMAYAQYKLIPKMEIPDNMIVQLAVTGPWKELNPAQKDDDKRLRDWNGKLNAKTYLWNYATKCGNMIEDIPNFTPRAVGSYYKRNAPYIFGAFLESETDYWLFGFLNSYIFSKVMWDTSTDVDQLIGEHCRLMYGAGAPQMEKIYEALEKHWLKNIMGDIRETKVGPQAVIPSRHDIWTKIYSVEETKRIDALFDDAEKAAKNDSASLERIRFMRGELWGKLLAGRDHFEKASQDREVWTAYMLPTSEKLSIDGKLDETAWKNAPTLWMIPRKGALAEVNTRIKLLCDKENFYIGVESDEPHTAQMLGAERKFDDINLWRDNLVELFFAPGPTSETIYQIMLGSNGNITDMRNSPGTLDLKWNSGLEYKPGVVPGKMWCAEMRIPRESMPEISGSQFVANFTRGRVLKDEKVNVPYYVWSPFRKQTAENCGKVVIGVPPEKKSVILDGDFTAPVVNKRFIGKNWFSSPVIHRDTQIFRTAGASARLDQQSRTVRQFLSGLKPDTKYKLSFFVRLENVAAEDRNSSGFYLDLRFGGKGPRQSCYPLKQPMTGTVQWQRLEFEFTTPGEIGTLSRPYIGFNLPRCSGSAWIDHVELSEAVQPR